MRFFNEEGQQAGDFAENSSEQEAIKQETSSENASA